MSINKRVVYDRLPGFAKDGIGWVLRLFPTFQWQPTEEEQTYHAHLFECERKSAEELRDLQFRKLSRLLAYAYEHVPYYRRVFDDRGMKPQDIRSLAELRELPLLTKDDIRSNPADFMSDEFSQRHDLTEITTGGSTGTPMRYLFDAHMVGVRRAHWWRWSDFAGVDLYRDRMIYCGGAPKKWVYDPNEFRGVVNYQRTQLFLSSAAMSDSVLDRYIDDIRRFRGDYIRGYASGIYMLAARVLERGLTIPMKAVLTSSDTLFPQYRGVIEQAFACKVYDHYGQNEDIITATECGHASGLHINVESCIAEVVDEQGCQIEGAEGKLVGTHLENRVMPLIRYVVGDVGSLEHSWKQCACGRYHQRLLQISGRDNEIILTPNGRRVRCGTLCTMHASVRQCQYIQEALDLLVVKVIPTSDWREHHRTEIVNHIRHQVGSDMHIEIQLVDEIPSRPNGKYQFIVSKLGKGSREV